MISPLRRVGVRAPGRIRREPALEAVHALPRTPLISLVMPTYETPARYLSEAIRSVRRQRYPVWELCIVDDGSASAHVRRAIERHSRADERIKPLFLARNEGISTASNAALELASGEYVGFLDHDDLLTEDALLRVAQALTADQAPDIVYSDADKLTAHGQRVDPFFKPDWSPVYALGAMYIGHLLVVRRALLGEVGGFDPAFDKIQDFELMMRLSERTDRIHHIPRILYHWRAIPGSIAAGTEQKSGVSELQARAVSEHLARIGTEAFAVPHPRFPHRARLEASADAPAGKVTAVIAWGGDAEPIQRLLASLAALGPASLDQVIVVGGSDAELPRSTGEGVELISDSGVGFSHARAANRGAAAATGEHLLFLSDSVELLEPGSIERLLLHARLPGVAAVGPLLVHPDGRAAMAGVVLGLAQPAMPTLSGVDGEADGYYGAMACAREVSAASADCLLVGTSAFAEVGGFDEWYATEYDDFDLCQRLISHDYSVIYAPRPRVIDHELPARRRERADVIDRALFVDTWFERLRRADPYFNPNLSAASAGYAVER